MCGRCGVVFPNRLGRLWTGVSSCAKPTSTTLGILCLCVPREYPKVAAVFPNRLGRLSTDVSGCATPQNPSRIDSLSFIDFGRHSVFCVCANPENTRKLLQSFQIDLDDSGLLCLVAQLHNTRAGLISVLHQLGRHSVFCVCANPENTRRLLQYFQIDLDDSGLVVSGCATPQYPSWIDLCPSSTLTTLSILFFANPENTRELLQFFQIDLDDSPLVVFGGATSVNSN